LCFKQRQVDDLLGKCFQISHLSVSVFKGCVPTTGSVPT
jgi:hypothetical protein